MAKKKDKGKKKLEKKDTSQLIETAEFDVLVDENKEINWRFFAITYSIIAVIVAILFRLYFLLYWGT